MVYSLMVPSLFTVGFHILILFSFLVDCAMSTNYYLGSQCNFTDNYTAGGAFEANMRSVFSTLTKDAPPVLFANTTAGQGWERVYGLVQCRGDVDQDTCNTCISNSTVQIVDTYCPYAMDAIIWYEKCQLRYSNTNFFGRLTDEFYVGGYTDVKVDNPKVFYDKLGSWMKNLSSTATTEPSSRFMFATGKLPYTETQTLYGLVQCTMDISLALCEECLESTFSNLQYLCSNADGCEAATGSCRVGFGMDLFYLPTIAPSPSPNSAPPSNLSASPSPPTGSPNTASETVNHSGVISVTMITVITFALTSIYMF